MKSLIDFYKSIGESVGIVSDAQGFMSTILPGGDTPKPWTANSKRVVLPYPEQLKQPDWSNRIGFHPLLQNVTGGESQVMEKFRDRMNGYGDFVLGTFFHDVASLALKSDMHPHLTYEQAAYLGPFKEADATFVQLIYDLVTTKRISKKNFEFVHFTVIKGRVWEGQKRSRVSGIHFPLYKALPASGKGETILGRKLRQKDVRMLRAMYQYLFPGIEEAGGHFEIGSDSKIGPSIESLMAVYAIMTQSINQAVSILEPVIASSTALMIVDDWRNDLDHVEDFLNDIRKIPMLEGNSPSERVAQLAQPQRISADGGSLATQGNAVTAPVLSPQAGVQISAQVAQVAQPTNQVQDIQGPHSQPRFKLGVRSPVVQTMSNAHQLPNTVGNEQPQPAPTIGYGRTAPSLPPPTPPVGALLEQQRVAAGLIPPGGNMQPQMQAQPSVQAVKLPDTVRLVNNQMYIPLEANGVSAAPAGMILIENRPYVPLNVGGAAAGMAAPGMMGAQQQRMGVMMPQQITDPSQIPGLSMEEINYFRSNPVMFQNYLSQIMNTQFNAANAAAVTRANAVPRYLQNAVQQAQQQQQMGGMMGYGGRRLVG